MGKGKGAPEGWVCIVRPGRILFEMEGVDLKMAEEAMRLAAIVHVITANEAVVVNAGEEGGIRVLYAIADKLVGRPEEKGITIKFRPVVAHYPAARIDPRAVGPRRFREGLLDARSKSAVGCSDEAITQRITRDAVSTGYESVGANSSGGGAGSRGDRTSTCRRRRCRRSTRPRRCSSCGSS